MAFFDATAERPKVMMVDPPSGWKYGFPKVFTGEPGNAVEWLVANGYPQREVDACGDYFYIRMWEEVLESKVDDYEEDEKHA